MTYPLLEQAPKDHNSEGFLQFLRENNTVVFEQAQWLVIENCKYHTVERPWYTAFHKKDQYWADYFHDLDILFYTFDTKNILIKHPDKRSVSRPHVHLVPIE